MADRVRRWEYCYLTATYFLLLEKKLRGQQIRMAPSDSPMMDRTPAPKRNLVKDCEQTVNFGFYIFNPDKAWSVSLGRN
jgi:hypothetical protein